MPPLAEQAWNLMWRLLDRLAEARDCDRTASAERLQRLTDRATTRWQRRSGGTNDRHPA
jgi:hypothetical protein